MYNSTNLNDENKLNAFMNISGHPYIFDESIKQAYFRQVDRSRITNSIAVHVPNYNYTILDIVLDDIGKGTSNDIKYNDLLASFASISETLNKNIDVMRKGLLVQIKYQIENKHTGEIIRECTIESLVKNIEDYTIINSDDANDNTILTNFHDFINTTIVSHVEGCRTTCRIVEVKLFYLAVSNFNQIEYKDEDIKNNMFDQNGTEYEFSTINNQDDQFYHFTENYDHIILNHFKIEHRDTKVMVIPAGSVTINKTFDVNIAHKILFKISVWKNDIILVNNTIDIAKAIGVFPTVQPLVNNDAGNTAPVDSISNDANLPASIPDTNGNNTPAQGLGTTITNPIVTTPVTDNNANNITVVPTVNTTDVVAQNSITQSVNNTSVNPGNAVIEENPASVNNVSQPVTTPGNINASPSETTSMN